MTKWYNKPIAIVTKRNFVTVLLFINSLFFYIVQKISDSEMAKDIGISSLSMGIGQYIGEKIGFNKKKNVISTFLLLISILFYFLGKNIENGETITLALIMGFLGEEMGFHIGKMRAKKRID